MGSVDGLLSEYEALVARVDGFTGAIADRCAEDLACQKGCASCCQVALSVSAVEAAHVRTHLAGLDEAPRVRFAERARAGQDEEGPCCMLEDSGACAVYPARPLVCRTQGHALLYPTGLVPLEAVRARARGGEVTWCPENYTARTPDGPDILDASRIDTLLAVVNRRYAERAGKDPEARLSLRDLALVVTKES